VKITGLYSYQKYEFLTIISTNLSNIGENMGITLPKIILLATFALALTISIALCNQTRQFAGPEDCGKTSEWLNVCPVNFSPGGRGGPGYIRGGLVALGVKL